MAYETASQCWTRLSGIKQPLMTRVERYASLTIPKVCLPVGYTPESTDETHDYQSIGAQATNHLTNKIMLALFAPSRPFFRVQVGKITKADLAQAGMREEDIAPVLAKMERDAMKELDSRGQRPKLYATVRHLIVTGNVLLVLGKEDMRVMGVKYFCVKRDNAGKVHTLIIKERLKFDELDADVQGVLPQRFNSDDEVDHYRHIMRQPNGDYVMTQWVNEHALPQKFSGKWPEDKLPYRVLTWDLADESDYGTGLVEEYAGDLEALSVLSESVVDGAVLGTEYRWLVNPTGMTSADDLNKSKNGDALNGLPTDIAPTQGGNPQAIAVADSVLQRYERRVALGFLMQTAVTRNAERVTAEEIRQTAQELETAYGGIYSALANGIQHPVALWLLGAAGAQVAGTDLKVAVITGLDALSRNGDLENLRLALADLAQVTQLPEALQGRINFQAIAKYVGDGRGIDLTPFLKSEEQYAKEQAALAQQRVAEASAIEGGKAAGQVAAQQGTS